MKIKVISLFDGISCARVALERAGFEVDKYYASEIDKYAILIAQKNYPDTIQVGSITTIKGERERFGDIDLMIGGSPCQDLSVAKRNREGLDGKRSNLFWEYVRLLNEIGPRYFILENVNSMPQESKKIITDTLGVSSIMIDAGLVSAQRRRRLFWTNISGVVQPKDRGVTLKDIIDKEVPINDESRRIEPSMVKALENRKCKIIELDQKANTCTTKQRRWNNSGFIRDGIGLRYFTPLECERLQCLPDFWTSGISTTQRYQCLGNAFNVDVIAHILSFIPKEDKR